MKERKRTVNASLLEDYPGEDGGDGEDEVIGPMPVKAGPLAKKRKALNCVLDHCYHYQCDIHNANFCSIHQ